MVLDHAQAQRRQVEHLPGLDPNQHRTVKALPAPTAPLGHMLHHLVRLGDLGQMSAGRAGLLARLAALRSLIGRAPLGPRGLAQPVRRRWLGGVGGVLAQATLQLADPAASAALARSSSPTLACSTALAARSSPMSAA